MEMISVRLTKVEWKWIIAALAACTPSGGGSEMWNLTMKVRDYTQVEIDPTLASELQQTVKEELEDDLV